MRTLLWGLAGLALAAIASPAFAAMVSFTLDHHRFHFDIPPGYAATRPGSPEEKPFRSTKLIVLLDFTVEYKTMAQEFDHLKAEPRFRCEYLDDGRVGYCAADNEYSVFGRVFAKSCSGQCIMSILVMATGTNEAPEGKALLQKYAKILALGDFGGE